MTDFSRIYPFQTVFNFRDFGRYGTTDGREVSAGKLFRAAHLNRVSDEELDQIADLDIGLLVDLRYKPERERQPNRVWGTGPRRTLEFTPANGAPAHKVAPHEAFIEHELTEAEDARRYMQSSYRARPDDPGFRSIFKDTLHHMVETGEPILIHCAAGKDRTGTLAALILTALGVNDETILADFMLTMEAVDVEAFLQPAAQMMSERFGKPIDPEALRPMFGVEESYLQEALTTMGERDAYLRDALNIGEAERAELRARYLSA
jgi:protein-tyrosine phosphatase